jgi:CubicO group peptidase (beta-lactamase class C family)
MKLSIYFITSFLIVLTTCKQSKSSLNKVENTSNIINETAVKRLDSTLQSYAESGKISGVSALVFEKGKEVYSNAFGYADREAKTPMARNTIALIYSMTKPITGAALMQLYEKGLFELDDTLSNYLPEFKNMQVYTGVDTKGNILVEPLKRPISIRDLTRHTADFINNTNVPGLGDLYKALNIRNPELTLTQQAELISSIPLLFQPGEQWEYGISVDIQALLVERLSGQPFDTYVNEHILNPLEMHETRYFVPESDRKRLAATYKLGASGLKRVPDEQAFAFNTQHWPLTPGGFGLTSTLDNYMRFARMLVNKGTLDDITILKPETVKLMATNHLSENIKERAWLPSKGQVGFGIDFAVRLRPPTTPEENNGVVGEFFWDVMASTLFWVDPVNELTAVLFVQLIPFDGIGLHKNFRDAVYGKVNFN